MHLGKEIQLFFNMYGAKGVFGIIISCILTGLIIYEVFKFIYDNNINSYNEFTEKIQIKNNRKNNRKKSALFKTQTITNMIINIFLLISYYIMVAGFATYLKQSYNIPIIIGAVIMNILNIIVFIKNVEGIVKVNTILIPIAIITIITLGIQNIDTLNLAPLTINKHWGISAILYYSYNSIILIPIIITLKQYIQSKKEIKQIGIITTALLIVLSIIIYTLIANVDIKSEMPLVDAASNTNIIYKYTYGLVILIAIFTTAISSGYSFLKNTTFTQSKYILYMFVMTITSIPISFIGFGKLVNILYPIFGILGIIQIIKIYLKKLTKTDIKYV